MYTDFQQIKKYLSLWLLSMFIILSIMIIVGGLTRLTDSGLSITEWELFSGILPPMNETAWNKYFELYKTIPEYKLQNFSMTMSEFKVIFWWEFIHRFLGRLIGIFYLLPLIYFSIKIGFSKTKNLFFIFLLICFQGFIGWYMVSSGLIDRVDVSHYRLALHLVLAFIILSLILWNYFIFTNYKTTKSKIKYNLPLLFLFFLFIQITIGAFVSGMDAGKIYNSWPLMGNTYFPDDNVPMNLLKISVFNDASLNQFIHRNLAYFIIIIYLLIVIQVYRNKQYEFFGIIKIIGIFLAIQIFLGIITILSGAHIITASLHQISSIFLVSASIFLLFLNSNINSQPLN